MPIFEDWLHEPLAIINNLFRKSIGSFNECFILFTLSLKQNLIRQHLIKKLKNILTQNLVQKKIINQFHYSTIRLFMNSQLIH
jgi:hypothetical protein